MISGTIHRQKLYLVDEHIVAETIDYLEARFYFKTEDWDGLEKWAHFSKDGTVYDILLTDDGIRKEDHLNLDEGDWQVCIHGNKFADGKVIERITTNTAVLHVLPAGVLDGEPFQSTPASVTERILARLLRLETLTNVTALTEEIVNRTRSVQPLVTFVDDDGHAAVWDKLKPLSEQYGIPFVVAMITDHIGTDNNLTAEQLVSLQGMGWEIASHTMGHMKLGELTDEEQEEQLRGSKEALEAIGLTVDTICYPNASVSENTWAIARKYYRCGRRTGMNEWMNESLLETWDLRVSSIATSEMTSTESGLDPNSLEYYKYMVDRAATENAWLIFMTHCSDSAHDDTQQGYLVQVIEYVQSLGLPVVTIREGLDLRGNIVDTGRYTREDRRLDHFTVGCDGALDKSDDDTYMIRLDTDAVTNATPPSAFPEYAVSTCRITTDNADGTGFPLYSQYKGGVLITNTMGPNADQYSAGTAWQEFRVPKMTLCYRRYSVSADAWSNWATGDEMQLDNDSVSIDDLINAFPRMKSRQYTTKNTDVSALPGGSGYLITDRSDTGLKWLYQLYVPATSTDAAGYLYYRRYYGGAWHEWISLGERAATTDQRNSEALPKTVGASVFDTDLGKPVWWNGTAWVDASGAEM